MGPSRQTVEVHAIRIIRDGKVVDALEGQSFQTLRREQNLDSSMLDGVLTAILQPRDVRVGDVLETAFTVHDTGGVLAPHQETLYAASAGWTVDRYRVRASWPADRAMRASFSEPWADVAARRGSDGHEIEIDERGLAPLQFPADLPVRYRMPRTLQITDLASWSELSALMAPLYEKASTLEDGSPLHAEIERIRQAHDTPEARAVAALRMVQDDVRYVALAMGAGGYVPTSADDTWRNRYGDCKGKTVLLMALLRGLGIEAEPALVSTTVGDGLDRRLPMAGWFDHVVVRATVDGRVHWIDGTRQGDRKLGDDVTPGYRWALPARAAGAELEALVQAPASRPFLSLALDFDATKGLDAPAGVKGRLTFTGDGATALRAQLAAVPADQLRESLESMWKEQAVGLEIVSTDSQYDDAANAYHFTMTGTSPLAWIRSSGGRFLAVPNGDVDLPVASARSAGPYKDLPFVVAYPLLADATVTVALPRGGENFRLEGGDIDIEAGGYRIERRSRLEGGVVTMTNVSRTIMPEVAAADMSAARDRRAGIAGSVVRIRAPADYRPTTADGSRAEATGDDRDALLERSQALADADDLDGALALADRMIALKDDDLEARVHRGMLRLAADDFVGAREDMDKAVDLDPADIDAVAGQGQVAMADGRYGDAIISFSVALRLDPADAYVLASRGEAYRQIGRTDRSLADYSAARTARPDWAAAQYGEMRALLSLDRKAEAQARVDELLKTSATDGVALGMQLRLAVGAGKPEQALPALDAAVAAAPESTNLRSLRAEARIRSGDEAGARADFDVLRQTAASDPFRYNNACWTQGRMGFDLERAMADCDAALALLPEAAAIIDSRAMVLLHMGRFEEAKAVYDAALEAEPTQMASLYGRGLARLRLGDPGGEEDLARARARDVDSVEDFVVFESRNVEPAR